MDYDGVQGMNDFDYEKTELRIRVAQLEQELADEREAHARTSELLMTGEVLRDKMMLTAILGGTFNDIRAECRPES